MQNVENLVDWVTGVVRGHSVSLEIAPPFLLAFNSNLPSSPTVSEAHATLGEKHQFQSNQYLNFANVLGKTLLFVGWCAAIVCIMLSFAVLTQYRAAIEALDGHTDRQTQKHSI